MAFDARALVTKYARCEDTYVSVLLQVIFFLCVEQIGKCDEGTPNLLD